MKAIGLHSISNFQASHLTPGLIVQHDLLWSPFKIVRFQRLQWGRWSATLKAISLSICRFECYCLYLINYTRCTRCHGYGLVVQKLNQIQVGRFQLCLQEYKNFRRLKRRKWSVCSLGISMNVRQQQVSTWDQFWMILERPAHLIAPSPVPTRDL